MMLALIGLLQVVIGVRVERRMYVYSALFFVFLFMYSGSILIGLLIRGHEGLFVGIILRFSIAFEFVFASLATASVTEVVIYRIDPERKNMAIRYVSAGMVILQFVLLIVTQFTGLYYTIDSHNIYHRSPGYIIALVVWFAVIALSEVMLIVYRKKLSAKEQFAFWIFFITPFVAVVLQWLWYGVYFTSFATTIAALVMNVFIIADKNERYRQNVEELAKLKVNIMLSQIRPHFIFNSLTAIQTLCHDEPAVAEKAIAEFSFYLRCNMDALSSDKPIRFPKELDYTRAYLNLEKLRFEDDLNVEYDIDCKFFEIPALTLQPMVENAVRHGIRETPDGRGTVKISTREYSDRYEIKVEDDGIGFDVNKPDPSHEAHIGIQNVRERLARVCGGTLEIHSEIGKGTTAVLSIPKGES